MATNYDKYVEQMRKIADISHSIAVLNWDKETYLPKKSAAMRSQQIATLSGIVHEEFTNPGFGNLLERLNNQKNKRREQSNLKHKIVDLITDLETTDAHWNNVHQEINCENAHLNSLGLHPL